MIQRIQTLYLLLAVVLLAFFLALPLGRWIGSTEEVVLTAFGIREASGAELIDTWPLSILSVVSTLLLAIIIFLFKRRWVQIRLCYAAIVLLIGLQGFTAWYMLRLTSSLSAYNFSAIYAVPAIFPLLALIFTWLSLRGIMKDEALVQSLNRLR